MGIQNLLRLMKPFTEPIHIKKYSGKRVGIDAYSWLHKGAHACSMELCLNTQGETARRYVRYFMHHVNLLRHHNITPVVVFDGGNIPSKSSTEDARCRKRHENLALAKERLKEGNVGAAVEFFQKAVSISPSMAHQVIQILRAENVEFVVAPYEADAQLAYLCNIEVLDGGISAVITEDSDLLAYGCQTVIFKMDRYGNGEEVVLDKVLSSSKDGISFQHFSKELFTGMCVLAGCDFLSSVPGIGIKRAYSLVSKYRNLDRVLSVLSFEKGSLIPKDYCDSFQKTIAIFNHARIYDPKTKSMKPMRPLPDELFQVLHGQLDILGPELLPSVAASVAEGRLNPITMEAFDQLVVTETRSSSAAAKDVCVIAPEKSGTITTGGSCFTIFSSKGRNEEKRKVAEESCADKYTNEASAFRNLVTTQQSRPEPENAVQRGSLPDNNPFKRRKLEARNSRDDEMPSPCEQPSGLAGVEVEETDEHASPSPEPENALVSKLTKRVRVGKEELSQGGKGGCKGKTMGEEKNTILKFFNRV